MLTDIQDALLITGGEPLSGDVRVNTAKNSTLILMLAALLTDELVVLNDVPRLSDVTIQKAILEHFGARVSWQGRNLVIHARTLHDHHAPFELVGKMRASFVALGALLGRCGEARISMPGGCAFGPRPVDRHIKAFRQLGVAIREEDGDFDAKRLRPLSGRVTFEAPTVGGTQNVMLASALGTGRVVIENAALEPEIIDLARLLNAMGARIYGGGTPTLIIDGVPRLHGATFTPIPDRIEAGTFMLAAAATRGMVTLRHVNPTHLRAVTATLREMGVRILELDGSTLVIDARAPLRPSHITAVEYPGVPTDLQAPFSALFATVPGESSVTEQVFLDRFSHVGELGRMGAGLELAGRTLSVQGGALRGASVHAADLRAGGALVIAALAAKGESSITGVQYLQRGYEALGERLRGLGASVRTRSPEPALATGT